MRSLLHSLQKRTEKRARFGKKNAMSQGGGREDSAATARYYMVFKKETTQETQESQPTGSSFFLQNQGFAGGGSAHRKHSSSNTRRVYISGKEARRCVSLLIVAWGKEGRHQRSRNQESEKRTREGNRPWVLCVKSRD